MHQIYQQRAREVFFAPGCELLRLRNAERVGGGVLEEVAGGLWGGGFEGRENVHGREN